MREERKRKESGKRKEKERRGEEAGEKTQKGRKQVRSRIGRCSASGAMDSPGPGVPPWLKSAT